jgi:hypothetical protein
MLTKMGMPNIKDLDGDANRGHCQLPGFGLNYLVAPEVQDCVAAGLGLLKPHAVCGPVKNDAAVVRK